MDDCIDRILRESREVHAGLATIIPAIREAARIMIGSLKSGGKVLFAGNGGSAADAQHLAAELVNRFLKERAPMAGLALSTDTSIITAIGNDYSFDDIFVKQVQALGRPGDVFLAISTSGNSANLVKAVAAAKAGGIVTIGLTGQGGGRLGPEVDHLIAVPSRLTPRVQECHILIGHILCELIEEG